MRRVHAGDLIMAARVLGSLPQTTRPAAALAMVRGARLADRYRKRLRKRHALWGDGTLAAAALAVLGHRTGADRRCGTDPGLQQILRGAIVAPAGFDLCRCILYAWEDTSPKGHRHGRTANKPAAS